MSSEVWLLVDEVQTYVQEVGEVPIIRGVYSDVNTALQSFPTTWGEQYSLGEDYGSGTFRVNCTHGDGFANPTDYLLRKVAVNRRTDLGF